MPARKPQSKTSPEKPVAKPQPKPRSRPVKRAPSALATALRDQRAEALRKWRAWAYAVADGGALPPASELSQVAFQLQIKKAARRFEESVSAILLDRKSEARAARKEQAYRDSIAPYGSEEAVREKIRDLEKQLEELREIVHPLNWYGNGEARARNRRLNPLIFGDFDEVLDSLNQQAED